MQIRFGVRAVSWSRSFLFRKVWRDQSSNYITEPPFSKWNPEEPITSSENPHIEVPGELSRARHEIDPASGPNLPYGSNSSYNCTPFLHSLLTKGKQSEREGFRVWAFGLGLRV